MFSFGKAKNVVNLSIDPYAIRMVENNGKDLSSITLFKEKPMPPHVIEKENLLMK